MFFETLKKLREKSGKTQQQVAELLDISIKQYQNYEYKTIPPHDKVMKLSDIFNTDLSRSIYQEKVPHETETYISKRRNQKNNGGSASIPIFESGASTLTTEELYRDEQAGHPDFWVSIPFLRDCDYGTRAKGDSMHPLIRTNALIIGKRIHDFSVIIFGEIYTILTKNNIETTKYIHPHPTDPEWVLLVPYNDSAKTTPIPKADILKIWEAKAVFNNL